MIKRAHLKENGKCKEILKNKWTNEWMYEGMKEEKKELKKKDLFVDKNNQL